MSGAGGGGRALTLPPSAAGLQLYRIDSKENLIACEALRFDGGEPYVNMILRRASMSGRVEVGGEIENHFADVLDDDGDMVETVALDRGSYGALKNHWMRCKVEREPGAPPHPACGER